MDEFLIKMVQRSAVLGILLGYGKTNALNFEKKRSLSLDINQLTAPPLKENLDELNPKSRMLVNGYAKSKQDSNLCSLDTSFLIKELNKLSS